MIIKNKKIIIGFVGDKSVGKTTAADVLVKKGFNKVSINTKVKEFASHLFSKNELQNNEEKILNEIRERGLKVHKGYWLNLILITIPENKNYIVFDDIRANELMGNKIKLYQIYRPNFSKEKISNIETIINDGNKQEFIEKIDKFFDKIIH